MVKNTKTLIEHGATFHDVLEDIRENAIGTILTPESEG
jgi:hypothetical protein